MKQVDKLFVGMSIEDERAAIGVKRHFQHAAFSNGSGEHWESCRDRHQSGSWICSLESGATDLIQPDDKRTGL